MRRRLAVALAFAFAPGCALAAELPLSQGRLDFTPSQPLRAAPGDEIVVEGRLIADAPARMVLRVDDSASDAYGARVNDERLLPPGPFRWRLTPAGAKTSGGRLLDPQNIRHVSLFVASPGARVEVSHASLTPAEPLPVGARGFSFGHADAPLFPGFERIAPKDPRIEAGSGRPIRRPGVDPLIGSGMRALERIRLPWPAGRARVTLWTEDVGEWESLPQALLRRIRVNGVEALYERMTPQQWIERRYLAGRDAEIGPSPDSWTTYGARRGRVITVEAPVGAEGVKIELAGESPVSTFLSAVLIEPAGQHAAADEVERRRADWFRSMWRVAEGRDRSALPRMALPAQGEATGAPLRVAIGGGSGARVAFEIAAERSIAKPRIVIDAPTRGADRLSVDLWAAQRRLDRRSVGLNLLEPTQTMLRGEASDLPVEAGAPRRYVFWVNAPAAAQPGAYVGAIAMGDAQARIVVPLQIEVLPVELPKATRAAGFYLDEAPHLTWFPGQAGERRAQITCDLAFLSRLGVTGVAPALATPSGGSEDAFVVDSLTAARLGAASPWLAYTPAKRLRRQLGPEAAARKLAAVSDNLRLLGIEPPVWSIADEPGNPGHRDAGLAAWAKALRDANPRVRLGAQLNHPADMKLIDLFDTVLINDGFGLDLSHIAKARRGGRDVWLYNTGRPRLTAGYWLVATEASRYLQWHARMPTADPFDPTDGREGDVQVFFPNATACPALPDIHEDALAIAEGLVDQRWLAWLKAQKTPAAERLLNTLEQTAPTRWQDAVRRLDGRMGDLRNSIMAVARSLK